MKKHLAIFLPILAAVIAIDQLTKAFLFGKTYPFLSGFISIHKQDYLNTGGAWGFLGSAPVWLLISIAALFIVAVLIFNFKFKGNSSAVYSVGLAFVLGGTIGNLIDRIFLGGVRDFLMFDFWQTFPVFNMADTFLCIGCVLLIIYLIFLYKPKKKQATDDKAEKS